MTVEINPNIAVLSYGIAFIGIYVAVCATEQLRGVFVKLRNPTVLQKLPWLICNGICIGIISFWGMNYVSFSGLTLRDDDGKIVPITFNPAISLFSLLMGFLGQVTGVYIACGDRFYAKTKAEVLDFFVESRSVEEILTYSESYVAFLLVSKELTHSVVGGTCAVTGVVGVYFIGLASFEFPGYITFNGGIIFAALFIGVSAAITAYWLFFRVLSIFPNVELFRIGVAAVGGVAICGIHYIAIIGTNFHIDYSKTTKNTWKTASMTSDQTLYPILLGSMIMLWLISMAIFADLRAKINAYRTHLQKLSPNENLSTILLAAENLLTGQEASQHQSGGRQEHALKKNAVAPLPFNDDESPL